MAIIGKHYEEDKIKFTGHNTQRNICWRCSANTYEEIYYWLVKHNIINRYDYDPVDEYLLNKLGKTYDDYSRDDEIDFDQLRKDGNDYLTDESYYEIITREDGNAYYQEWEVKEAQDKDDILSEYLDVDFGNVEGDQFHIDGYIYLSEDTSDKPYRAVQFCGCYIPLDKRKDVDYVNEIESECKQYIEDCSEETARQYIEWYLNNSERL